MGGVTQFLGLWRHSVPHRLGLSNCVTMRRARYCSALTWLGEGGRSCINTKSLPWQQLCAAPWRAKKYVWPDFCGGRIKVNAIRPLQKAYWPCSAFNNMSRCSATYWSQGLVLWTVYYCVTAYCVHLSDLDGWNSYHLLFTNTLLCLWPMSHTMVVSALTLVPTRSWCIILPLSLNIFYT